MLTEIRRLWYAPRRTFVILTTLTSLAVSIIFPLPGVTHPALNVLACIFFTLYGLASSLLLRKIMLKYETRRFKSPEYVEQCNRLLSFLDSLDFQEDEFVFLRCEQDERWIQTAKTPDRCLVVCFSEERIYNPGSMRDDIVYIYNAYLYDSAFGLLVSRCDRVANIEAEKTDGGTRLIMTDSFNFKVSSETVPAAEEIEKLLDDLASATIVKRERI